MLASWKTRSKLLTGPLLFHILPRLRTCYILKLLALGSQACQRALEKKPTIREKKEIELSSRLTKELLPRLEAASESKIG